MVDMLYTTNSTIDKFSLIDFFSLLAIMLPNAASNPLENAKTIFFNDLITILYTLYTDTSNIFENTVKTMISVLFVTNVAT